ncbi:MAG: methionyl-tRNA formyltransferase [bacterium]|nr:methionyl-tRNA formyltransferase [bacterium]
MRIVFFGTPDFALPTLDALHKASEIDVTGVLTQPDRPAGRGKKLKPSPVKAWALEHDLPVLAPEKPKNPEVIPWLHEQAPEAIVVVAYGGFVPRTVRELPPYGCVNLHPSLLPRYRGAAPIQWALLNGDGQTGNSTMYLSAGWDDGDLIYQEPESIDDADDYGSLSRRLAEKGAVLMVRTLIDIEAGTAPRTPQPEQGVVMAPMIQNEDARVNWNRPAREVFNLIRGLSPIPGAFTEVGGERLKLFRCEMMPFAADAQPGEVISTEFNTIRVAAADGQIEILELQPPGKRRMRAADYLRGHPIPNGARFV